MDRERQDIWADSIQIRFANQDRVVRLADMLVTDYGLAERKWECKDERTETLRQIAMQNAEEEQDQEFLLGLLEDSASVAAVD